MTEHGVDLFFLWRWMLAVTGAVYTATRAIQSLSRWLGGLDTTDRINRIKQHYIVIHLLRIRLRDFWWELCQIVLLAGVLMLVVRMHYYL
ncbi:MAG: hypothetical protein GWP14_07495 [Actinobacteria bacterium]|nr:hypothetical protein [Actinomycetota bacterium]